MNSNENNEEVPTVFEDGSLVFTDVSESETIAASIAELGLEGDEEPDLCSDEVFKQRIELLAIEINIQQECKKKKQLLEQLRYAEDCIEILHQERQQAVAHFFNENSIRNDKNRKLDRNYNDDEGSISEAHAQLQDIDTLLLHHRKIKEDLLREIQTANAFLEVLRQKCQEATIVSCDEILPEQKSTLGIVTEHDKETNRITTIALDRSGQEVSY